MRFLEYLQSIPNVHFDIQRSMNEEIHVDNYHNFIGDKSNVEGTSIGNGLFDHGDNTYSFNNGQKKVKFKNLESATEYSEGKRNQFKKSLIDAHNKLSSQTNLSPEDTKTLRGYTDHLGVLNHKLLHDYTLTDSESNLKNRLDETLSRQKAPDDLVVYSGTNKNHSKVLRQNEVVNHPSYLSTSLSANSARSFANQKGGDIIKIHVPKGHPGAYVSHLSGYEGEREFVLPRNTKLRIHKAKEQTLIHDGGTFTVHHATIDNDSKSNINESIEFKQDTPGGSWLEDKQRWAEEDMSTKRGYMGKGMGGSVTGYFNKTLNLPVSHLEKLPGAEGEEKFRSDPNNPKMKSLEGEIGEPSKFDSKKHPIFVAVNHLGDAYVMEGNHRLEYAKNHRISHIHTEVRYFNGGEAVGGHMNPDKIQKLHKELDNQ